MHSGDIEELESQIETMLCGDHPRATSIAAIVEDRIRDVLDEPARLA
jgi:hypothetical protein